ncbi:MAG: AAA family ATPase [Mariprofundaceae bacterium]|nr:AAA family ATPase [Mariprofundaceae bacterium]
MQFPYGISNFQRIIENKLFYVDRTYLIPDIERAGDQLIFLRPRRFGKSLLLSMLENYYDIAKADQFKTLFGHLAIAKQPTPLHGSYVIMRLDFSLVSADGNAKEIGQCLHQHINDCISITLKKYEAHLKYQTSIIQGNAIASFQSLVGCINNSGLKLYLLIDEYDNFANELMMGATKDHYGALLHGEGAFTVRAFLEGVQRKTLSAWHISPRACLQGLKFSAEHLLMATKPGAFVCQYSTLLK